jgi:hypothetical protein
MGQIATLALRDLSAGLPRRRLRDVTTVAGSRRIRGLSPGNSQKYWPRAIIPPSHQRVAPNQGPDFLPIQPLVLARRAPVTIRT